jgi:hypothetical protein
MDPNLDSGRLLDSSEVTPVRNFQRQLRILRLRSPRRPSLRMAARCDRGMLAFRRGCSGATQKSSGTPQFRSNRRSFDCVDRVGDQLRCSDRDGSASRYPTLATKTKTSRGWGTQRLVISRCLRFSPCLRVRAGPRRSMGRSRCCFVRR